MSFKTSQISSRNTSDRLELLNNRTCAFVTQSLLVRCYISIARIVRCPYFQLFSSYFPISFDGYSRTLRTVISWLVVLLRMYLLHCFHYGLFDFLQKHHVYFLFFGLIIFTVSRIFNELFNLFLVCLVEMRI